MTRQFSISVCAGVLMFAFVAVLPASAAAQDASAPLTLASATVSLAGTSNIHEFTASTTEVRVTRLSVLNPGAVEAFAIAIRTTSLSAPREGIDKNMHKALKAAEFKDITFKLARLEAKPALRAIGTLNIAGVDREIAFDLKTVATATTLTITGEVPLLMTDYGIAPPKAMLGMLKTDPKITVTFEVVLAAASTTR
jgi:polyisoprenoid-binding protein YceI